MYARFTRPAGGSRGLTVRFEVKYCCSSEDQVITLFNKVTACQECLGVRDGTDFNLRLSFE